MIFTKMMYAKENVHVIGFEKNVRYFAGASVHVLSKYSHTKLDFTKPGSFLSANFFYLRLEKTYMYSVPVSRLNLYPYTAALK